MKARSKALVSLALALFALFLIAQPALAYTYPSSRGSSSSNMAWLPLGIIAVAFVAFGVVMQRQMGKIGMLPGDASAAGPDGTIKVSEVVKAKLMPGEKPLAQMPSTGADFVATDKRVLRFSSGGAQAIEYASLSGATYETPRGRRLAVAGLLVILGIIAGAMGIGIFVDGIQGTSRNNNALTGTLVLIFCLALAAGCLLVARYQDFGFYQLRSRAPGAIAPQQWQIKRHPFARKRIDGFARIVTDRIKTSTP